MPTRVSKPSSSATVTWSNGDLFDGYLFVGIVPPQFSGVDSPTIDWGDYPELVEIPKIYPINIVAGKYDQSSGVHYTSDLNPPNTQFVAWFQDRAGKVFGPSVQFTVTAATFTPPAVTLTIPSVGSNLPPFNT